MSIMDNIKVSSEKVEKQKVSLDVKQHAFPQADKANEESTAKDLEQQQKTVLKRKHLNHIKLPFPWKVQEMLANVEKEGSSHIVSWMMPHGKAFRVHSQEEFVKSIMPSYFNQTKFTSFTRQLYIYGFQKVQDGPDKGAFFHSQFVKENKSLCLRMMRKKYKPNLHQDFNTNSAFPKHQSRDTMTCCHAPHQSGIAPRSTIGSNHQQGGHHRHDVSSEVQQGYYGGAPMAPQMVAPISMALSPSPLPFQPFVHNRQGLSRRQQEHNFDEEDWLAKFERLTSSSLPQAAADQMLLDRPMDHLNVVPSLCYSSQQVRREDRLQAPSHTFESINYTAVLSSSNAMPRLQSSMTNAREEERIHPRMVNMMNAAPDFHQRNTQQHYKYVDPFTGYDEEEVDTDGGYPFFIDPF
jgi:hypothetical protein